MLQVGGAFYSWRLRPPRWLGAYDFVEACEKITRCSRGGFVRGLVLTPRGSRRATLVERVIELPSLLG